MKQFITLLACLALSVSFLSAQNTSRTTGDMSIVASAGYGTLGLGAGVSFDYTVLDFGNAGSLSVGGLASDSFERSTHVLLVGPMVTYRYPVSDSFELSARTVLGYGLVFNEYASAGTFGRAVMAGATYYISDKIGIGAELGAGGVPNVSAHVVIRL